MSATYGAPVPPALGPVRSPRGFVDVEVTADQLVLRHHDSWRDWIDSDLVTGFGALLGIAVFLAGLVVGGPLGVAICVLGVLMVLPIVVVTIATYAATAWFAVRGFVMLFTRRGRARLKQGAAHMVNTLGGTDGAWRLPRGEIRVQGPVELGTRARLRLATAEGDVVLSTLRRHRGRLEAVAWALQSR